jgi:glycoprotease/Kae1 family metallohydrolase
VNEKGKILSDARSVYKPPEGWGIKPQEAASHHKKARFDVLNEALRKAGMKLEDVDIISFSQGAGLPPCLRVGKEFAVELAGEKDLVPVCHQVAHLEIARLLTRAKDPVFLYVSGGNTQVISFNSGRYRVFGETQDMGIGNALDKFARETGLGFPGGPRIESLAGKGKYVELPYVVKGMDLSFSGILTSALEKYRKGEKLENLCFSLQETLFSMLAEVTERALAHTGKSEVVLTGGVAANRRLTRMLTVMARERGARYYSCPLKYTGDNGVMIAWAGILARNMKIRDTDIKPRLRTDDVEVGWL